GVRASLARAVFLRDQPVSGHGIRHSQERLRQDHQSEPLFGGERVGVKEVLDTAESPGPRPNALDEAPRVGIDPPFGLARARGLIEQGGCHHLVGGRIGSAEEWRGVRLANVRIRDHDGSQGPTSLRRLIVNSGSCNRPKNNSRPGTKWQGAVFEICEGPPQGAISPCALECHVLYLAASIAVHGGAVRGTTERRRQWASSTARA